MENYDNLMDFFLNTALIAGEICVFVLIVASYFTWKHTKEAKKINSVTKKRHPNPKGLHVYNDKIRTLERRIEFKLERTDGTITNEIHALYYKMNKEALSWKVVHHDRIDFETIVENSKPIKTLDQMAKDARNRMIVRNSSLKISSTLALGGSSNDNTPARKAISNLQPKINEVEKKLGLINKDWKEYVKEVGHDNTDEEIKELFENRRDSLSEELSILKKQEREERQMIEEEKIQEAHLRMFNKMYNY